MARRKGRGVDVECLRRGKLSVGALVQGKVKGGVVVAEDAW
jgi:hypothetical protein